MTPSQSTAQSTPSTPHSTHQQLLTLGQYSQQAPPGFPAPGNQAPQPPLTVHQQYPTHFQQHPMATAVPQPPQTRSAPYVMPSSQTAPIAPIQAIRPATQTTAKPATTPLAYSTLNVNVSVVGPSHTALQPPPSIQGSAIPGAAAVGPATGSYQYVSSFPPGGVPGLRGTSPVASMQQRTYAGGNAGANTYPGQNYKSMTSFIGSGLTRPTPAGSLLSVGAAVGRGSVSATPPRGPPPLPHTRSNVTPQTGYPGPAGHGAPTQHHPQSGSVRPTAAGSSSGSIGWSQ